MARRIVTSALTLLIVSIISFAAVQLSPGDPAELIIGGGSRDLPPEALSRIRSLHGLDRPVMQRYLSWVRALASGDLGVSLKTNRPIIREFQVRIPVTVTIAAGSLICALVIGLAFGLASVLFEGRIADHLVRLASVACHSVPVFIIGLILLYLFSFKLAWFPLFGLGSGEGLVLPICTLGLTMGFSISRLIRNSLLEAIHKEYFLAAIAKGLSYPQAISRHALKNAAPLLATYLALRFASLLGGTVLVESVFALPGMGSYVFEAISSRDYPVIQAYIVVLGVAVVLVNLAADLLVRAIAPRATLAGMN